MNPKEKAKELFDKMDMIICSYEDNWELKCKQCALISVDEMIDFIDPEAYGLEMDLAFSQVRYLEKVKEEIENL
jgi:hypothetical protein